MLALIWDIDIETIIKQFTESYETVVLPNKRKIKTYKTHEKAYN